MRALPFLSDRSHWIRPALAILAVAVAFSFLAGCSEETTTPVEQRYLRIDGVLLAGVVIEGEATTLSVWGANSSGDRVAEALEVEVVRRPGLEPGYLRVSVVTAPSRERGAASSVFEMSAELPALPPGDYTVEFAGTDRREQLHVFPRGGWVWYHAHAIRSLQNEGLMIRQSGQVFVYRNGLGGSGSAQLDEETMAEVVQWFEAAGFAGLEDRYVGGDQPAGERYDVTIRGGDLHKRVVADEALAPEGLVDLVRNLSGLITEVLANRPIPQGVVGGLEIVPVSGDAGSERMIRLTLTNNSPDRATLRFPTSQLYDLMIVKPAWPTDQGTDKAPHQLLWNWAYDRTFALELTELILPPGTTEIYEEVWNGMSNTGEVVGPGSYLVLAEIPAQARVPVHPAGVIVVGDDSPPAGLVARVALEPMFAPPGTERELTLAVTNTTEGTIPVTFVTTQRYDFAIENPMAEAPWVLWQWSFGQEFDDDVATEEWAPGETKVFTAVWDGTTADGAAVGLGRYVLRGWLTSSPDDHRISSGPVSFAVMDEGDLMP